MLEFFSFEIWRSVPSGCCGNKFRVILFTTVSLRSVLTFSFFYFRKGEKATEARKGICEVYGVNCSTERTCQNLLKNFVLEISH